jgi:hypothetical protein
MKGFFYFGLLALVSCAGMKEDVKGYSGAERTKALNTILGKTPPDAIKLLGEPVAKGYCEKDCNYEKGIYQFVYLEKTIPRYSLALSMANRSELSCFIIDFRYNSELDKHIYDGGYMDQVNCAQDYGAIARVRKMK